ncbi:MAG: D-alanyl-D-alanine carboxypeptidase [Clostridiales bacterium]|nr:D-alanyl-D-alanine carboxypeptidase [Clostridiales bacterium]
MPERSDYIKILKKMKLDKIIGGCMAVLLLLGGGYVGISQFEPDESDRNYQLIEESMEVSLDEPVSGSETDNQSDNQEGAPPFQVNAKAAILMDAGTGEVLYKFNENEELPPASVTKVMTMLLALEAVEEGKVTLNDEVRISENAAGMGGSQMYMEPGEVHTLEELMKGIAMVSANDGCVAVAEYLAGSVEIFVENMNSRAEELGMEHTHFVNTNGLPADNHYSSAKDIAIMSRELLKHTEGHDWFTTWQDTVNVGLPGKETEFGLTNTNKLIKQYQGAIGLKTGFTSDAGYCLSGAAQREDTKLIAVVLGCETSNIRLQEISKLLDYGFANYETVKIAENGEIMGEFESIKGSPEKVSAVTESDIQLLVKKGNKDSITHEVTIYDDIKIPLEKGDKMGELIIKQGENEIQRYDLVAEEDVKKAGIFKVMKRLIEKTGD